MRRKGTLTRLGLVAIASCTMLGVSLAQEEDDAAQLRAELERAREALEEAAREVARLSAQAAEPFTRNFTMAVPGFERRALLGVSIEDAEDGVRVLSVTPGGGADAAGIVTGDVIVALEGAELTANDEQSASELLIAQMRNVDPGEQVAVRVLRDGAAVDLLVEAQPAHYAFFGRGPGGPAFDVRLPDVAVLGDFAPGPMWRGVFSRPFRELELVSLTPELGSYFGTEEGLLVVRAPRGEGLELQDGDVILDIGGRRPTSPQHAMRILGSFEPGETLTLNIMRQRRRETLEFVRPSAGEPG